jgi:DNA processing protein
MHENLIEKTYSEDIAEKSLWIGLSSIHGIGSQTFCQLLHTFGNPSNIFDATYSQLKEDVLDEIAAEITKGTNHDAHSDSLRWLSQPNNHLVTLADIQYPKAPLEITDPPPFLYAKGNLALLNQASIEIVGSRNASVQGKINAEAFA